MPHPPTNLSPSIGIWAVPLRVPLAALEVLVLSTQPLHYALQGLHLRGVCVDVRGVCVDVRGACVDVIGVCVDVNRGVCVRRENCRSHSRGTSDESDCTANI
eukprot:6105468-Pyramimonas_sp.AAC.1